MDGLNEYKIQINEILSRVETIKAETLDEAIDIAIDMYNKEKIVLDADDHVQTDIVPAQGEDGQSHQETFGHKYKPGYAI